MGSERKAEDIYRDKKSRDRKGNECQNRKKGTGLDLSSSLEGKQSLFATEMAATMLVSVASAANGIRKRNILKKAQRSALKAASPKRSVRSNAASEEAPPPNPKSGFEYAQDLSGITAPLGFWDPASFCANTSPDEVKRFREAELTHGRVAMLAAIGYLVGELPAVENNPLFNGAVSGPALRQFQQVEAEGGFFLGNPRSRYCNHGRIPYQLRMEESKTRRRPFGGRLYSRRLGFRSAEPRPNRS